MGLLDSNVKTIIGTEPKHNWKDYIHGIKPSWDLKDEQGNLLGKFKAEKGNWSILYNLDGSILIKFHSYGVFRHHVEIRDSKNNLLTKTSSKIGLKSSTVRLENTNGDKILECKDEFTCPIWDQNENTVAELKFNRWKNNWTLNIHEPNFDKIMILGLSLALVIKSNSGDIDGSSAG